MTIFAPTSFANLALLNAISVEKWLIVTIIGTFPATCSIHSFVKISLSSSDNKNCSE